MQITNHITPNFTFSKMIPQKGLGSRIWDVDGKEYVDLSGGIAVNALGHCNPDLIEALTEQAKTLWHCSNIYTNLPSQELAKKLVDNSFADKVFFCNSGAEANEAAAKLARKYAHDNFGEKKARIITAINSFHGRTLFTVTLGGQKKYSEGFGPLPGAIDHVPFNDIEALEKAMGDDVCAIMLEPIQGESGVLPATREYLKAARDLATRHDALLILDEVQTGMGHTGKLFCHEHYGVLPDIMSSAKALGSGFPLAAMLATDKVAASFTPGSHGSTFGGNPLATAVGSKAFDLINSEATYKNIEARSKELMQRIDAIARETGVFTGARGMGLLVGAVLVPEKAGESGKLKDFALDEGVMVLQAGGNVVRFAPSLLITERDLAEGLDRFERAVKKYAAC